ncbi:MAG: response regulator transcription factor [Bacteroidetes bacterium]|nr:response regulator transcription factor [Bacteroidota bacterium]
MINCLIVDDEPIARAGMKEHIKQVEFLNCVAECRSALEAKQWMQSKQIDLIFLDIQMPKLTGIDFVKNIQNPPLIVFTTAYPDYAVEGFELDILDYLLKPISFARFYKASVKAYDYLNLKNKYTLSGQEDYFFIKCNQKIEKIKVSDVLYIEGLSNYIQVHTLKRKYITYLTFKGVEEQLPPHLFIRIHKSFLVSINAIKTIDGNEVILENISLPISRSYKDEVLARISDKMLKRN